MLYRKNINSMYSINTLHGVGIDQVEVNIEVGMKYTIDIIDLATAKDRRNNGRIVEVLGFTESLAGDVVVRYLDNNRIGRLPVNYFLPLLT